MAVVSSFVRLFVFVQPFKGQVQKRMKEIRRKGSECESAALMESIATQKIYQNL